MLGADRGYHAVTGNLFSQGVISQDLVAISFQPTDTPTVVNGEVTFGGTDTTKLTGTITFAYVSFLLAIKCRSALRSTHCIKGLSRPQAPRRSSLESPKQLDTAHPRGS